jgi:hypothetical protein
MSNFTVQTTSAGETVTLPANRIMSDTASKVIPVITRDPQLKKPTVFYTPQQKLVSTKLHGLTNAAVPIPNTAKSQFSAVQRQFLMTEQRMKDVMMQEFERNQHAAGSGMRPQAQQTKTNYAVPYQQQANQLTGSRMYQVSGQGQRREVFSERKPVLEGRYSGNNKII